jgi:hypothetical protein
MGPAALSPLQNSAPDTPSPTFEAACREQAARTAAADAADKDLSGFLDGAFDDIARD